jgi:hypothetical protein
VVFFVIATAWNVYRWRAKDQAAARRDAENGTPAP